MIPAEEMAELRTTHDAMLIDTCTINEPGEDTFDPNVGDYVTLPGDEPYSGPCEVRVTESIAIQTASVGEQVVTLERIAVKVPMTASDVPVNSIVTITAVAETSDPRLVGKRYRVTGSHAETYATTRLLPCELVTP